MVTGALGIPPNGTKVACPALTTTVTPFAVTVTEPSSTQTDVPRSSLRRYRTGAANPDRRRRRVDFVILMPEHASRKTRYPLRDRYRHFGIRPVRIIDKAVEHHFRQGADFELGLVLKDEFGRHFSRRF